MKTNNKKKIVVSVLALAMGAGLAGSISGTVAWYQYSTRTSASFAGTTAGTSRELQISSDSGLTWKQHIDFEAVNFRPASVYGTAGSLNFVDHPVYKTAILPSAVESGTDAAKIKVTYNLVFRCMDTSTGGTTQVADKEVYLTTLNFVDVDGTGETNENRKDITPAVRIEIDGTNDFLVSKVPGTTTTHGNLNLNGNKESGTQNPIYDKDGYDTNDVNGALIDYRNAAGTTEAPDLGTSYTTVSPDDVVVGSGNPYEFTNKTGRLLTTTTASGNSAPVKITVWIEGWQQLDGSSTWDSAWLAQNFRLELQFACEANRL